MESILHPPHRCTCVLFEYAHIVRTTIVPMPSPPNDAVSGNKNTWRVWFGLPWCFFLAPNKKRVPPGWNPGCSGIPNPYHWIWIHSISTISNMFSIHLSIRLKYRFWEFHAFKAETLTKTSCERIPAWTFLPVAHLKKQQLTTGWSWPSKTMMNQIGFVFPWKSLGFGWW